MNLKPILTALFVVFSLVSQAQECDLFSWYKFDGEAADAGPGNNNGVATKIDVASDRLGNSKAAFYFNGETSSVAVEKAFNVGADDFSMTLWMQFLGKSLDGFVQESDTSMINWVISKGISATTTPIGAGYGLRIRYNPTTERYYLDFILAGEKAGGIVSVDFKPSEDWRQVGISRAGKVQQLFLDGKMVQSKTSLVAFDVSTDGLFGIGAHTSLPVDDKFRSWFMGSLDDIKIFPCGITNEDLGSEAVLDKCFPQAYFPFNRGAYDMSLNKLKIEKNTATLVSDRFGNPAQAYGFDGRDDFMYLGDNLDLSTQDFTISFWFMAPEGAANGPEQQDGNHFSYIISKGLGTKTNPAGAGYGIKLLTGKSGSELQLVLGDAKGQRSVLSTSIDPGKRWYHVAAQREGKALRIYLNGVLTETGVIDEGVDASTSAPLMMGAIGATAEYPEGQAFFYGLLDEVRFYPCVMSKYAIAEQAREEDQDNECDRSDLDVFVASEAATCGLEDGVMYAKADGGKPAYSFVWSHGSTDAEVKNVPAGLYSVVVTDQLGCRDSAKVVVENGTGPTVTVDSISISKCDQANGGIFTSIDGDGPFEITWSNGEKVSDIDALKPGFYAFSVRDVNGCVKGVEIELESNGETAPVIRGYIKRYNDSSVVTNARVTLIQYSTERRMLPLEQTMYVDTNGYFAFEKIIEGNFMVVVEPDEDYETGLFRAYYPTAGHWLKADPIPTACGIEGDITIYVPSKKTLAGVTRLEGSVQEQLKGLTGKKAGEPIPGIDVSLEQVPGGTTAQTTTDEDGLYTFDNIPPGEYEIIIDIPGLPMDSTYDVSVDDTDDEVVQLDYLVDTTDAVYIEESVVTGVDVVHSGWLSVYPNPFNQQVTLSNLPAEGFTVQVVDVTGRIWFQNEYIGVNQVQLLAGQLPDVAIVTVEYSTDVQRIKLTRIR